MSNCRSCPLNRARALAYYTRDPTLKKLRAVGKSSLRRFPSARESGAREGGSAAMPTLLRMFFVVAGSAEADQIAVSQRQIRALFVWLDVVHGCCRAPPSVAPALAAHVPIAAQNFFALAFPRFRCVKIQNDHLMDRVRGSAPCLRRCL